MTDLATDFLLELRSEEIPARMQDKAREDLARLFAAELDRAGMKAGEIVTYATPRRLALIARELPAETAAVREETKGPRTSAPAQALEGFLRKTGLSADQLTERDGVWFAVLEKPGRKAADVLAEAIPAIVRAFPWPKSMRWGAASASTESLRWVRPLQGIVALFGDDVVPCEIAGVVSGAATVGHRFHHPGVITIGSAADYVEKLRACHVIVDQDERRAIVRERASALAAEAGLSLIADEGLVAENAGLTEWPVPLLGRFEPEFLSVPPEVIQLTARVNQKYFVCSDASGKLANAFVCTANIEAADGGERIVEGNRKVLAARLSDARFFYETDLKVPLAEQAKKLEKIVFHEKLGTVADKVERVAKLARWLVEEGIVSSSLPGEGRGPVGTSEVTERSASQQQPSRLDPGLRRGTEELADMAERAARLAKADLVTGMVGEFPELQGLMGGYYAGAQGEDAQVAEAVRDHYKPVGQGDEVPTAPVTVAVSLADKLDTLRGFFLLEEPPTGSKDPFALRRAALGVIRLVTDNGLRGSLSTWLTKAVDLHLETCLRSLGRTVPEKPMYLEVQGDTRRLMSEGAEVLCFPVAADAPFYGGVRAQGLHPASPVDFFADRLKVQQREAGVRHDLIDAVFALGGEDDLVRLLARVRALQAFVTTEDGANLLAGYKRAANILKKEGYGASPTDVIPAEAGIQTPGDGDGVETTAALDSPPRGNDHKGAMEPAEADLLAALDAAEPAAARAVAAEDFEAAMAALATLRGPIDAFFEGVIVNDPDPAKRARRLALLDRVRTAVHTVADFSKIEG
nr:glycine--tRNA ligase subunit beta [Sphingomonas aracearum]